jgi:galactokinase
MNEIERRHSGELVQRLEADLANIGHLPVAEIRDAILRPLEQEVARMSAQLANVRVKIKITERAIKKRNAEIASTKQDLEVADRSGDEDAALRLIERQELSERALDIENEKLAQLAPLADQLEEHLGVIREHQEVAQRRIAEIDVSVLRAEAQLHLGSSIRAIESHARDSENLQLAIEGVEATTLSAAEVLQRDSGDISRVRSRLREARYRQKLEDWRRRNEK